MDGYMWKLGSREARWKDSTGCFMVVVPSRSKNKALVWFLGIEGRSDKIARRVRWGRVEGDSTKTEWGWRVAGVWIYGGLPRALVVITAVEGHVSSAEMKAGFGAVRAGSVW